MASNKTPLFRRLAIREEQKAILDDSESVGRDLTASEVQRFDALTLELKALGHTIASRGDLEAALHHFVGLPRAASRLVASGGWPALAASNADVLDEEAAEDLTKNVRAATNELRGIQTAQFQKKGTSL